MLILRKPRIGVYPLIIFSLSGEIQKGISPFEIDRILGILILVSYLVAHLEYRLKWEKVTLESPVILIIIAGIITIINQLLGGDELIVSSIEEFVPLVLIMTLSLVISQLSKDNKVSEEFIRIFLLGTGMIAIISIIVPIVGLKTIWIGEKTIRFVDTWGSTKRIGGIYGQPNMLATILVLAIPVSIYYLLTTKRTYLRLFWGLISAACLAALLMSQSRSAIIGVTIGLSVMGAFAIRRKFVRTKFIFPLVILGFAVSMTIMVNDFLGPLKSRFSLAYQVPNTEGNPNENRLIYWKTAMNLAIENPLGSGSGAPGLLGGSLGYESKGAHNAFVGFLIQYGILGFIGLSWLAINMLKTLLRSARHAQKRERQLYLYFLLASLIGFWIHNLAHSILHWAIVWIFFASAVSAARGDTFNYAS